MNNKFNAYKIVGLPEHPSWWQVRTDEISAIVENAKIAKKKILCRTANNYPLFALYYNCEQIQDNGVNWSAAGSSSNPDKYKSTGYEKQTVLICAGIHGAEPEGVEAVLNLISLMETGKDLRGKENERLLKLLKSYRLICLPCVNMDGRSICPDHLRGASYEQFRKASQGAWLNGKYINWQESKEYFPLPLGKVEFPGGYPNGNGYNIMHDCAPGCLKTAEAAAILELVEKEQADLFLNLHSHEGMPVLLQAGKFNYEAHVVRGSELHKKVTDAFKNNNLIPQETPYSNSFGQTINLNTAVTMASGALSLTFESTVSDKLTFDQILESHYILFEEILKDGVKQNFSPRKEIV